MMPDLGDVQAVLDFLLGLPEVAAYALIAAGSTLENLFPPVPSDTFVVLGGVLADRGSLEPIPVLVTAWLANVTGAMFVFSVARRRGPEFFASRWGRRLLRPHQFDRVSSFYERHGLWAIFFSRFLPVLRVVIPTFAGFTGLGVVRTLIPIATASLLWNGLMVGAGVFASRNVARLLEILGRVNAWLIILAVLLLAGIVYWWIRSRRGGEEQGSEEEGTAAAFDADRETPA